MKIKFYVLLSAVICCTVPAVQGMIKPGTAKTALKTAGSKASYLFRSMKYNEKRRTASNLKTLIKYLNLPEASQAVFHELQKLSSPNIMRIRAPFVEKFVTKKIQNNWEEIKDIIENFLKQRK